MDAAYFAKYRKFVTARPKISPHSCDQSKQRFNRPKPELDRIKQRGHLAGASTEDATGTRTPATTESATGGNRGPFRRLDGHPILVVGRNARENDELAHLRTEGEDLWLHARGTPGSHVVVRLNRDRAASRHLIRDAAVLALLYSDLKKRKVM